MLWSDNAALPAYICHDKRDFCLPSRLSKLVYLLDCVVHLFQVPFPFLNRHDYRPPFCVHVHGRSEALADCSMRSLRIQIASRLLDLH